MFTWSKKEKRGDTDDGRIDAGRPSRLLNWLWSRGTFWLTPRLSSQGMTGKELDVTDLQQPQAEDAANTWSTLWNDAEQAALFPSPPQDVFLRHGSGVPALRHRAHLDHPAAPPVAPPVAPKWSAQLMRTIEGEVIPRLLLAHRVPAEAGLNEDSCRAPSRTVDQAQIQAFVQLLLSEHSGDALGYAQDLLRQGTDVATLYLELFGPAARELGDRWCEDRCSFATVTLGMVRLQQAVFALAPALRLNRDGGSRRTILLAAVPGEQHTFGISLAAEFFISAGWDVVYEPAATEAELIVLLERHWIDVIGLTCSTQQQLPALTALIRRLRKSSQNGAVGVLVGGGVFGGDPLQAALVGADALAVDARHALAQADDLVALLGHRT